LGIFFFFLVPNLLFFGSQEAVKKFGPKIGFSIHLIPEVVD
jgi:hypothetical protein